MRVDIPRVGERTVLRKGAMVLGLENHRGGLCLLSGSSATGSGDRATPPGRPQRHFLGLAGEGCLELAVRAPEHRVRICLTDRLTLVPGGRLKGYVVVPLPHRLSWCRPNGRTHALLDVGPKELRTSWLGEGPEGGYVHDTQSGFYLDRHDLAAETVALVPVVILNHSQHVLSPEFLTVSIRDRDLREVEGRIIASPRRLHFGGPHLDGALAVDERIRALPRRSA